MQGAKALGQAVKDVTIITIGGHECMDKAIDPSATEPPPQPRETWTYTVGSALCDPGFCCYAWFCPTCANSKIEGFMKHGSEPAEVDCTQAILASMCPCDAVVGTRERVREHTNIIPADGCPNMICLDTMCCVCWCWGCAMAQEMRELRVWYGTV
eukprot:COSAG04_NODE_3191_length_3067_cov_1.564353_4_plen_154_part_01